MRADGKTVRIGNGLRGYEGGAHWGESIEGLAPAELAATELFLPVAGANVVSAGVAEHMVERIGAGGIPAAPSDHDDEFSLVVDFAAGQMGGNRDGVARVLEGGGGFHKKNGMRGKRTAALLGVFAIVQTDAKDGGRDDGGQKLANQCGLRRRVECAENIPGDLANFPARMLCSVMGDAGGIEVTDDSHEWEGIVPQVLSGGKQDSPCGSSSGMFGYATCMELTEKLLISLGGWPVMKQARAIHSAGRVTEASYEPPLLRGRLSEGGKSFSAGLRMRNSIDIENICPCRESRIRGIICAHSVAVGLQVLNPREIVRTPELAKASLLPGEAAPVTGEVPEVEFTIEGSLRHLEAAIAFHYTRPEVRNPAEEGKVFAELLALGFEEEKGKAVLKGENAILQFFAAKLPVLRRKWKVAEGGRFQNVTRDLVRIEPQFAIRDRDDGWLDFHVHYTAGAESLLSANDVHQLLQSGQSHVRLRSGKIAIANPELITDLEEVLRDCEPRQERGAYRVREVCRGYLETSMDGWKTAREGADQKNAVPENGLGALRSVLRPYQVEGACWLLDKARRRGGGLLADEMGLGKTVQALAMMEQIGGTTLVVCPSSLVWNWRREAEKFIPSLRVLTLDGADRISKFADIANFALVVTSYTLLRRDIERYKGVGFAAVVLDEAQHIKNPDSLNARAACALSAQSRFILTGTPIENSIRDLWSLYEFLLPGYLGHRKDFQERYETPLLNGERGPVWERLQRRINPFLLRRRKRDILTELPDKIEQVIEIELTKDQKSIYTQLQIAARSQVDALRDGGSAGVARMRVLTALLRLRQACCDVRLLGAQLAAELASAKLTALLELLEEAVDSGSRVLVFSQFTGMLDRIEEALGETGMAFCRLDGSTKDREAVVSRFQNDATIPVFLISLKAGGVGLNLTAADTVIHFDPWWNPAVEAQATDRAHRIGQTRVVTSIKLIARDTVEERVLRMQQKKRELLEGTVDADAALTRMGAEDLAELVA